MTERERERLVEVLTLYNSDNFKENLKNYLLKTAMVKNEKRKQSADREWQPPSNPRAGST